MRRNEQGQAGDMLAVGGGCLAIIIGLVAVLAIAFGITWAAFGLRVATAGLVGRGEAHIQIQSANFRIQAYDHFHDLCAAVQRNERAIDNQEDQLAQTTSERTKDILRTSIAGTRSAREGGIAQYNEDAKKNYTIGQFRDNELPFQLDTTSYERGNYTICSDH